MPARRPWNKDRAVGPRSHLEVPEVAAVDEHLSANASLRDLALFTTAIDTMLRCSDVLQLRVRDVTLPDGTIRDRIQTGQKKNRRSVFPTLTPRARQALTAWIKAAGKRRSDYLFTAYKIPHGHPFTDGHYRDLVKEWVAAIGMDPTDYSTHSLRRTKPVWMWRHGDRRTVTITVLQQLLGHKSPESTIRYLGLDAMEAQDTALAHDIFSRTRRRRATQPLLEDREIDRLARAVARHLKGR